MLLVQDLKFTGHTSENFVNFWYKKDQLILNKIIRVIDTCGGEVLRNGVCIKNGSKNNKLY